jgi:hypothetical protein
MFSNRHLLVYVIIAWSLLLLRNNPWSGDEHQQTARQVQLIFPELKQQLPTLQRVLISDKDSSVEIKLAGEDSIYAAEQWLVKSKNHPVDRAQLMYLLDGLGQMRGVDLVSIRATKHEVYGVSDNDGTRVQIFDNTGVKVADWIAGAIRSQDIAGGDNPVFEYYMRRADSDEVYLSGGAIQPSSDAFDWCDVNFLRGVQASQINSISRFDHQHDLGWVVERIEPRPSNEDEPRWQIIAPLQALIDNFSGDSLAYSCSTFRASGVITLATTPSADNATYGFPLDSFTVSIEGNILEFELGFPARDGHRYLRVNNLQHIYTISDFEVGQLRQDVNSLYNVK